MNTYLEKRMSKCGIGVFNYNRILCYVAPLASFNTAHNV